MFGVDFYNFAGQYCSNLQYCPVTQKLGHSYMNHNRNIVMVYRTILQISSDANASSYNQQYCPLNHDNIPILSASIITVIYYKGSSAKNVRPTRNKSIICVELENIFNRCVITI